MASEQIIPLPDFRYGSDWPLAVRVSNARTKLTDASMQSLAKLSYSEETFIGSSAAPVRHGEQARIVAQLDQSIAIAFDSGDVWKARRDPSVSLTVAGLVASLILAPVFAALIGVSRRIQMVAKRLARSGAERKLRPPSALYEFQAIEQAADEIAQANAERDAERVRLLAVVSHDLRAPVRRLRLQTEFVRTEDARAEMFKDLDEIDMMIDESMRFLKREDQREEAQIINVVSWVQKVCDDAADLGDDVLHRYVLEPRAGGGAIDAEHENQLPIWVGAQPFALRRAIMNVVSKAVRNGGKAEVRIN